MAPDRTNSNGHPHFTSEPYQLDSLNDHETLPAAATSTSSTYPSSHAATSKKPPNTLSRNQACRTCRSRKVRTTIFPSVARPLISESFVEHLSYLFATAHHHYHASRSNAMLQNQPVEHAVGQHRLKGENHKMLFANTTTSSMLGGKDQESRVGRSKNLTITRLRATAQKHYSGLQVHQ